MPPLFDWRLVVWKLSLSKPDLITERQWKKLNAFLMFRLILRKGDRLEVLITLIEAYEEKYYMVPLPDLVEAILYYIESRGLSRRDIDQFICSRARVSDLLNRKRPLTIGMIRKLHADLGIPAEVLIQPYS
jgi:HTH-type transcriptional regulator/antitoxin HigA